MLDMRFGRGDLSARGGDTVLWYALVENNRADTKRNGVSRKRRGKQARSLVCLRQRAKRTNNRVRWQDWYFGIR